MVVKDCGDEGTMLPLYWAGALLISQSPITAYSDGDGTSLAQYANAALVNIAQIGKVKERRGAKSLQRAFLPMKINPLSPEPLIG